MFKKWKLKREKKVLAECLLKIVKEELSDEKVKQIIHYPKTLVEDGICSEKESFLLSEVICGLDYKHSIENTLYRDDLRFALIKKAVAIYWIKTDIVFSQYVNDKILDTARELDISKKDA